ncbi:hypothetical protein HBI20_222710 [Parastagonospora nodorum]|nr:hypothetical protein HBI20_222710 [Parastagonospora nodorum]
MLNHITLPLIVTIAVGRRWNVHRALAHHAANAPDHIRDIHHPKSYLHNRHFLLLACLLLVSPLADCALLAPDLLERVSLHSLVLLEILGVARALLETAVGEFFQLDRQAAHGGVRELEPWVGKAPGESGMGQSLECPVLLPVEALLQLWQGRVREEMLLRVARVAEEIAEDPGGGLVWCGIPHCDVRNHSPGPLQTLQVILCSVHVKADRCVALLDGFGCQVQLHEDLMVVLSRNTQVVGYLRPLWLLVAFGVPEMALVLQGAKTNVPLHPEEDGGRIAGGSTFWARCLVPMAYR